MTILDRKPLVYVWRPAYRVVFGSLIWPFLERVKAFFFRETAADLRELSIQLANLNRRLEGMEREHRGWQGMAGTVAHFQRDLEGIGQRFAQLDTEQRNQWEATRRLLLCLFSNSARYEGTGYHVPSEAESARSAGSRPFA